MIFRNNFKFRSSLLETYSWPLAIAWTIIIGGLLIFGIFQIRHVQREMAKNEALANFNKDLALRSWAARHGGVYVPATDETPPNPYLSHVSERDITTPSGKLLTLMNPAYILRQTMDNYESLYGVRGHITSLKHFRPETAPDEWEKSALKEFERGAPEISEFTAIDGKPYFRYMSPMIAKKECLKCHGHQEYKVGDVRGGVSVSVPMALYLANQWRQTTTYTISFSLLWTLGLVGIVIATQRLKRKIRETKLMEKQLLQSEKLASVGELAAGVAHEINNPINGVINYAQILIDEAKGQADEFGIPQRIIKEAERVAGIVKNLLDFARKSDDKPSPVAVGDIIADTLELVGKQLNNDGIILELDIQNNLPKVNVNSLKIQQVFVNLCSNARYALNHKYPKVHENKILTIESKLVNAHEQQFVQTIFHDRGTGISPGSIDRVCDPFFSEKPQGKGTGLGLSISYGIVRDYEGHLSFESEKGEYTKAIVDLPAVTNS